MTTSPKRSGRPSRQPAEQTFKDKAIYALLIEKLPAPFVRSQNQGCERILDTLRIAKAIGVSRYTVYRILNDEKLSKKTATGLIELSDGRLDQADVLPFLMRL